MTRTETVLLDVRGVVKEYRSGSGTTAVLNGVNLSIGAGESVAIAGPSGCGKSTLLNLIGSLDAPTSGTILFEGEDVARLRGTQLAQFRNRRIGFVFQFHHLLPQCSVIENVMLPTLASSSTADSRDRAIRLLDRVGLSHRLAHRPAALSGGERQRAAVVRALINKPSLLLADEPTGSLNEEGAGSLARLMLELNREEGMGLLVVTHSMPVARMMDRVLQLHEGVLEPMEEPA